MIKSSWAYNNGKREMKRVLQEEKTPLNGWLELHGHLTYAKRNPYNPKKLEIIGYANRSQAEKRAEKLKAENIDCWVSAEHPYKIIKNI